MVYACFQNYNIIVYFVYIVANFPNITDFEVPNSLIIVYFLHFPYFTLLQNIIFRIKSSYNTSSATQVGIVFDHFPFFIHFNMDAPLKRKPSSQVKVIFSPIL